MEAEVEVRCGSNNGRTGRGYTEGGQQQSKKERHEANTWSVGRKASRKAMEEASQDAEEEASEDAGERQRKAEDVPGKIDLGAVGQGQQVAQLL